MSIEQKSGNTLPAQTTAITQGPSVTTNNTNYRLPCDATLQKKVNKYII